MSCWFAMRTSFVWLSTYLSGQRRSQAGLLIAIAPGPNCCREEPEHIINSPQSLSHLGLLLQIAIQLLASMSDMLQFDPPTLAVIGMLIPPFNGRWDSASLVKVSIWYECSI